jgi:hypothetical protein
MELSCVAAHTTLNPHMKTLLPTANQALHNCRFGMPILSTCSITSLWANSSGVNLWSVVNRFAWPCRQLGFQLDTFGMDLNEYIYSWMINFILSFMELYVVNVIYYYYLTLYSNTTFVMMKINKIKSGHRPISKIW